ncbi:MAG: iron ABC transporter permease [Thermoprotei archaeon]|nr:MAG: iron ABC transporter permease [Thermoprotei archaeon]
MVTKILGIKDLLFGGLIIAILSIILQINIPLEIYTEYEPLLIVGCIVWSLLVLSKGFDPLRLIYSFSWSFISVVGVVYSVLICLLQIYGFPRLLMYLILPVIASAVIGYIQQKISTFRQVRRHRRIKVSFTKKMKSAFFKIDTVMIVFIIISVFVLITFLVVPVLMMLRHAFDVLPDKPWYEHFRVILTNPSYVRRSFYADEKPYDVQTIGNATVFIITGMNFGILLNSLINATIVTIVATVLGILVAFILARYDFYGKTLFRILATVPLFVTPFANAYVVKILFNESGPISALTYTLFGFKLRIIRLAGVALAQIMSFYPIVYLNAYSSFINVDPSMEEQAENLGAKGLRLFFTVTLPLALPGIAAGSILVFIFSLEDLGAPIVFNEARLMSYRIFSSLTGETGTVTPEIAALGFVLLGLAVIGFLVIRSYVGMRAYAMISRGGRWHPRIRKVGLKGHLLIYLLLLPLIIFTALPQIGVILMAFNIIPPRSFTLQFDQATPKYIVEIFTGGSAIARDVPMYIRNTITYALSAVGLAIIVSLITAYVVSRTRIKVITPMLDTLATIPIAIPGLVVALGYYYFYSELARWALGTIENPGWAAGTFLQPLFEAIDPASGPPVFQAWIVLIIAYTIRKLPFVARSIYAGFQQVHEALEEAALNLGAGRLRTIATVVLPLIITNIVSGALIGFIYISTEVSTSVTIGSINSNQAPMTYYMMTIYKGATTEGIQHVAAMGFLLIMFQLIAVTIVTLVLKQRYAFIGI